MCRGRHSAYNLGKSRRGVRACESSRNCLDCSDGVHRIPPDWPGPANFQQPLNYGRIPRSSNRISPCHHVHSPGGAPTKTCFDCTFHRTNPAVLGHSPRKPRLRSEAKTLIQTGRLEAGDLPRSSWFNRLVSTVTPKRSGIAANTGIELRRNARLPCLVIEACRAAFGSPPTDCVSDRERAAIKDGKGL